MTCHSSNDPRLAGRRPRVQGGASASSAAKHGAGSDLSRAQAPSESTYLWTLRAKSTCQSLTRSGDTGSKARTSGQRARPRHQRTPGPQRTPCGCRPAFLLKQNGKSHFLQTSSRVYGSAFFSKCRQLGSGVPCPRHAKEVSCACSIRFPCSPGSLCPHSHLTGRSPA